MPRCHRCRYKILVTFARSTPLRVSVLPNPTHPNDRKGTRMTVFGTSAPPYTNALAQWTCVQCSGNIVDAVNVDGACRFHTVAYVLARHTGESERLRTILQRLGTESRMLWAIVLQCVTTILPSGLEINDLTGEGCQRAWHRPAHHNDYPYEAKNNWSSAIRNYTDKGKVNHFSVSLPFTHYR